MKVLHAEAWNFGSYPHLKVDFRGMGLALIYGPTGAGKSTLMDLVHWVLSGETARGGAVDDIRSWQAMEEPTKGTATIRYNEADIHVCRIRGAGGKNDLFWTSGGDSFQHRGKDLADTPRRLNSVLGFGLQTYTLGAYLHEFSPVSTFFKDKAKAQRALLEAVAPLEFPISLAQKASEARKVARQALQESERARDALEAKVRALGHSWDDSKTRAASWEASQAKKVKDYTIRFNNFERDKEARIAKLTESLCALEDQLVDPSVFKAEIAELQATAKCPTCAAVRPEISNKLAEIREKKTANEYRIYEFELGREKLTMENTEVNLWAEALEEVKKEINPFQAQIEKTYKDCIDTDVKYSHKIHTTEVLRTEAARLLSVYDLSFELRGHLLARSVEDIQNATNRYLHDYFDAEIKVQFAIEGLDSLQVNIQKSGYDCPYTRLSKGQACLLKLCFGVAVMKAAANAAGTHFDTLFFDEALHGLDEGLKVKAFRLFEELATEHANVLVIDHSVGLQEMFDTKFSVSLVGDCSEMVRDP